MWIKFITNRSILKFIPLPSHSRAFGARRKAKVKRGKNTYFTAVFQFFLLPTFLHSIL
jgi:hypothetical protein